MAITCTHEGREWLFLLIKTIKFTFFAYFLQMLRPAAASVYMYPHGAGALTR